MKVVGLLFLVLVVVAATKDEVIDGTKLIFSFLIHRHGDRTPVASTLEYSNNPTKLSELSAPYGYGQLTNVGKQRAYYLGKYIRSRYDELLPPKYNRSELYLRSTDSTRAKMTLLSALAAIYPPGENEWSQVLHWTPVPYTTTPAKYDFNLAVVNCPVFMKEFTALFVQKPAAMKKYENILSFLTKHSKFDFNDYPVSVYGAYDVYVSQLNLGLPLDPEVQNRIFEIEEAAGEAIDVVFGDESDIDLQAGVLLNEFFTKADAVIAGNDTQRFRVYSAHDINVFSFESIAKISNKQGVPKYCSAFSLEVRKVVKTGKYVVLPVYLPEPGSPVKYLQIEGCSQLCELEKFRNITSSNALDKDTWRTKCGWSKDLVIDDSAIN